MQEFNYHQHTYRCKHADLNMSDEDYIKEYIKKGFKKICFTDHCPEKRIIDTRPTVRMDYAEKDEYLKSINALKEKYSDQIEIMTGYEVEYLPGEEDNIQELKKETDMIVLGQHFVYDDNKQLVLSAWHGELLNPMLIRYAEYIDKAMELGIPDIIAHPDIFMNLRGNFGELEAKVSHMICKSAEKYRITIEINLANIFRDVYYKNGVFEDVSYEEKLERLKSVKYPCKEFWEIATKYNVGVIYGIDTHFKNQILKYDELIDLATQIIGKENIEKLHFIKEINEKKY